jgi:hypothetical protein
VHTVLLTWNPGPLDDHVWTREQWDDAMVVPHLEGLTVETTWGVGRHVNNIEPGDSAFMLRQGGRGRGIVARGVIRSRPWQAPHWQKAGETTNLVDVEWHESVPVGHAIDPDELDELVPGFGWRTVYSSGRQVPSSVSPRLEELWKELWDEHVRAGRRTRSGESSPQE